uniref:Putative ribonuclease H-like domain-containing protein n=1 Tax=Tanacetum cinerariifolium TaxID=118510 RepID=A0A699GRT6_TANCI|nr:putative ribonuclease H-like domain-containing protein [Tanacetum cinerariifolium]
MSVRTKVGLGFTDCISQNELGWDDSAFSVFTTTSEDVKGRPTFHRFSKIDSMKVVPAPLTGDYTSLSDHTDLDESQMVYGTKSSTFNDFESVTNDFVCCDESDKSSEDNTSDFASCDSSGKSSEHKPTDIESNVGTPITKPISFTCNSSKKTDHTSRLLIINVDCDFYEKQMANSTVGIVVGHTVRPQPVPTGNPMVKPVPTGQPKVKLVPTGRLKVNPVPTAKPKICDKKNQVLFTDTECLVLSKDFKLPDDSMVVLKVPRKHNLYTINLNDLSLRGNLACLVAHASFDKCVKWHRRMAHVNFKNINRVAKGNLVRGLPSKLFKNNHTCVACCKDKQHKSYYKAIHAESSISEPLQLFHMDLFGPTSIRSIDHKYYCLVITDDYSRFCWVFFLEHKDETYSTLKSFINLVENQLNKKVKAIRCDNHTKFKNAQMIELCGTKGIKREYSNPRSPQKNKVAERKNKTLIEAARTIVYVTNPYNKTPYTFLTGKIPTVSHFKHFGCHVTILNTNDHLGKFDGKADEGYLIGYSASNKAYRVYNVPTKQVEETMNLCFLKDKPNVQGLGHEWYFNLDYLTDSLGYKHVSANQSVGTQGNTTTSAGTQDADSDSECVEDVLPSCIPISTGLVLVPTGSIPVATCSVPVPAGDTTVPTDDVPVHTGNSTDSMFDDKPTTRFPYPSNLGNHNPLPGIFYSSLYDDAFDTALNNVDSSVQVSPMPTKRIHTIHPQSLIIVDPTYVALADPSWVDAMQEEMKQFKFQNVWVLVELPPGKYAIGTKWILKNKWDARGIVVRNKARLVAQGHRQEEGIDYDEVFALVARIEAIRLFLAFASYMGFLVYQMDVKSAFLYERIEEEVYVTQPKGFVDPQHPTKVYKVFKALYGLHQAPRAWTATTPYEALKPKPDIMFGVSECSRHQITPTTSNLEAVKKIFKYLKGQPKLGLWYPKESPLVLEAYSDSDYAGANNDRKSTTGGCQFLDRWLISWQCKKQTIVANFSTEAEYVAAANCCGQYKHSTILQQSSMAALKYKEEHNKVGYLLKPTGSDDYHQIIDFLSESHIRGMVNNVGTAKKFLMYPRFLQTILGIETRVNKQYKVLVFSSKLFTNMRVNFAGNSMPLLPTMLLQAAAGRGAETTFSDPVPPVLEHDHRSAQLETAAGSFPSTKDAHMGANFHTSPVRSSHTPPVDHPSGGVEDPITLTALSSVVSTLVQKVKSLEVKLKTKKRKMVVSDSDEEDGTTPNVNLEALRALANAAVANDSDAATDVPAATSTTLAGASTVAPGASGVAPGASGIPPGGSVAPTVALAVSADSPQVPPDASNKGKSPMIEEDIPVPARTLRRMEED